MTRRKRPSATHPSFYIVPLFTAVCLLILLALSTASTRLVERHYEHTQNQQTSIAGRVTQLNAARHGRGLTPNWLTTTLTVTSSLSLLALATRLALGRDGLSGVLRQAKRKQGKQSKPPHPAPPLLIHSPPAPAQYEQASPFPPPALPPPAGQDEDDTPIRWA